MSHLIFAKVEAEVQVELKQVGSALSLDLNLYLS